MKRPFGRAPRAGYRRGRCYITRPKTRPCGSHDATTFRGHTMSTRSLSALVSASCIFLVVACGKKEEAPPPTADAAAAAPAVDTDAEKVVNVYNWSDYIDNGMLDAFTQETGVKVNYEVMDSNELLETKLVAGRTG